MCAAFAPPLKNGGSSIRGRSRSRSRSHSPRSSPLQGHHPPIPVKQSGHNPSPCWSAAGSPSCSSPVESLVDSTCVNPSPSMPTVAAEAYSTVDGGSSGSSNTISVQHSGGGTAVAAIVGGGGGGRVALPTFSEIARNAISRDVQSTRDPFARARAREEVRRQHERQVAREQRERQFQQRLKQRRKLVCLIGGVVVVALGFCFAAAPTTTSEITARYRYASQKRGLFGRARSSPPPPPLPPARLGTLLHLSSDMPAVASSKEELWAVLQMAGIKADASQVDRAWFALALGELRRAKQSSDSGVLAAATLAVRNAAAVWRLTLGIYLACGLRSPFLSVAMCVIFVTVLWTVWNAGFMENNVDMPRLADVAVVGRRSGGGDGRRQHPDQAYEDGRGDGSGVSGGRSRSVERSDRVSRSGLLSS